MMLFFYYCFKYGRFALYIAAKKGHKKVVDELLNAKVKVNEQAEVSRILSTIKGRNWLYKMFTVQYNIDISLMI